MAAKKVTVVISQGQGKNPVQRQLEEEIAAALIMQPDVDVSLVPHLYDMSGDHTGLLFLRSVPGNLVVLSWLYPRAARWTLARQGVCGHEGVTLLKSEDEDDEELETESDETQEARGIGSRDVPNRKLYFLDLRGHATAEPYLDEIRRIADEQSVQTIDLMQWISGKPKAEQLERYLHPERLLSTGAANGNGNGQESSPTNGNGQSDVPEPVKRRWYPVIDYSRCTNCMECIDFCLFGVYGVDSLDTILVEQQDNCKKGCPACSRVCPENAIMFPGHKTPAIAGADGEIAGLKIDLSKLFGAPDGLAAAVAERDVELVADGRDAVGMTVGIPKRQSTKPPQQRDELDDLMDSLDNVVL
ncbi:MAG: ferredoxin family protein [Planctomycetaceae bacterium]